MYVLLQEVYDLGCRTIVVAGLPPIGCLPLQMTVRYVDPFERKCVEDQNSDAQAYNHKLQKLLNQMKALLPRSTIVYANIYEALIDLIQHPQKYGKLKYRWPQRFGYCPLKILFIKIFKKKLTQKKILNLNHI